MLRFAFNFLAILAIALIAVVMPLVTLGHVILFQIDPLWLVTAMALNIVQVLLAVRLIEHLFDADLEGINLLAAFNPIDSYRKVGGIRFLKVGRLTISFSLSKRG